MNSPNQNSALQFFRFALIGGFNTLFGYAVFAALNWSFTGLGTYSYMYAAALGSIITISVAFLGYKWFVFRTRGNYLQEWLRCFGVYGGTVLFNLACLPLLVTVLRHFMRRPELASYVAAGLMMVVIAASSFFGHKYFSFRTRTVEDVLKEEPISPSPRDRTGGK